MKRSALVAGIVVTSLSIAVAAWAKGPTGATIEGPGLGDPVELEGMGERGTGTELSELVEAAGFWQLVAGVEGYAGETGEIVPAPRTKDLGPMVTLTWHLGTDRVPTEVYPAAPGGPLVHIAPQAVPALDVEAPGRWFAAAPRLTALLERYGVAVGRAHTPVEKPEPIARVAAPETEAPVVAPAPATTQAAGEPGPPIAGIAAGVVAIALAIVVTRRRPGRAGAP